MCSHFSAEIRRTIHLSVLILITLITCSRSVTENPLKTFENAVTANITWLLCLKNPHRDHQILNSIYTQTQSKLLKVLHFLKNKKIKQIKQCLSTSIRNEMGSSRTSCLSKCWSGLCMEMRGLVDSLSLAWRSSHDGSHTFEWRTTPFIFGNPNQFFKLCFVVSITIMEDTLTPFDSYRSALLQPLVLTSVITSFVLLNGWYAAWNIKGWAVTDKQKAYVLSLLSSSTMTAGSIPLLRELWKNNWDLQVIVAERWWTVMLTSFFATFLFLDLSVGFIFYRKKIDLLTGWIHHTTYLITMAWILKNRMATIFVIMCVLEAPTFILALGSINSKLRRDYVFAFFFVNTRILFHAYMVYATYTCSSLNLTSTAVLSVFFPLHCYWFSGESTDLQGSRNLRRCQIEIGWGNLEI